MDDPKLTDGFAIVANHIHHGKLREGAKCYIWHDTSIDRVGVLVAIKGRKWALVWTRPDRLYDARVERIVFPIGSRLAGALLRDGADPALELSSLARRGTKIRLTLESPHA